MPWAAEKQRARRAKVVDPEETYIVEAGNFDGDKYYRRTIQYGCDFSFQLNFDAAKDLMDRFFLGKAFPHWTGTKEQGRFSNRSVFWPTWIRVWRNKENIHEEGFVPPARRHQLPFT